MFTSKKDNGREKKATTKKKGIWQANKSQMRQERRKVSEKETDLGEKQMATWITTLVSFFIRVQFRDEVQILIWDPCQWGLAAEVPKRSYKVKWWDKS